MNWLLLFGAIVGIAFLGAVYSAQLSMAQPFMLPVPIEPVNWAVELTYLFIALTFTGAAVLFVLSFFQK